MLPSLSEITPITFSMELSHLGLEDSIYLFTSYEVKKLMTIIQLEFYIYHHHPESVNYVFVEVYTGERSKRTLVFFLVHKKVKIELRNFHLFFLLLGVQTTERLKAFKLTRFCGQISVSQSPRQKNRLSGMFFRRD